METNAERRRKKLETFCTERGLKVVAEAAGLNWQYIDQAIKKTLLPVKKDGTRGYRKMSDEAFEKIEDAFKLGRGWFDGMEVQKSSTAPTPPNAAPSLADTLARLGELLERASPKTRAVVADLLGRYAQDPASGQSIALAIELLIQAEAGEKRDA